MTIEEAKKHVDTLRDAGDYIDVIGELGHTVLNGVFDAEDLKAILVILQGEG